MQKAIQWRELLQTGVFGLCALALGGPLVAAEAHKRPNVLIITGDHSTPAAMAGHSWHPVPTLLVGDHCRPDACQKFGEREALLGGLGHFEALHLMPIAMAHAGRLAKLGA